MRETSIGNGKFERRGRFTRIMWSWWGGGARGLGSGDAPYDMLGVGAGWCDTHWTGVGFTRAASRRGPQHRHRHLARDRYRCNPERYSTSPPRSKVASDAKKRHLTLSSIAHNTCPAHLSGKLQPTLSLSLSRSRSRRSSPLPASLPAHSSSTSRTLMTACMLRRG